MQSKATQELNCCLSGQLVPGQYDHCGCLVECAPACVIPKNMFCSLENPKDTCVSGYTCQLTQLPFGIRIKAFCVVLSLYYFLLLSLGNMSLCMPAEEGENDISHAKGMRNSELWIHGNQRSEGPKGPKPKGSKGSTRNSRNYI